MAALEETVERQAELIAGLTVALGAVIDVVVPDEMRSVLKTHLHIAVANQAPGIAHSLMNILAD
jgi:hypothetical protein